MGWIKNNLNFNSGFKLGKILFLCVFFLGLSMSCLAQTIEGFNTFRDEILSNFNTDKNNYHKRLNSFRDSINAEFTKFLRGAWGDYSRSNPTPKPIEDLVVPPIPYTKPQEDDKKTYTPENIPVTTPDPKPQPIEPIKENPILENDIFNFTFYGLNETVRIPHISHQTFDVNNNSSIANAWEALLNAGTDNTIFDLLNIRDKYNLCDWGYLQLLNVFSSQYCNNKNNATLLTAFLYFQSGYQMRLARDNSLLHLLYGSKHHIYEKPYYVIDGTLFYPYGDPTSTLSICPAGYSGETPMSLLIPSEQKLGEELTEQRLIKSKKYSDVATYSQVPIELLKFYDSYPTSSLGNDLLTRWAMYANTPLSEKTRILLYPALKDAIADCTELEATNKLLNWVQTGFVYEYDDKVWGHDRAFFAEETLYYPYSDCEDRSILFSRLIRDLLGLDVALIYYPGHLATAVKFNSDVKGDAMIINNSKYIVCDPTFIGAPVGSQMPDLEYEKTKAIILKK